LTGCGVSIFDTGGGGAAGPGLNGAEREIFEWTPTDRVLTYDHTSTSTVTLAPRGTPAVSGKLLIKIPVGDQGYYTVEYVEQTGWDRKVWLKHAVLIHEVRASDPSHSYLVARNIYGAWLPKQVFLDPVNHVRIRIDHFDDAFNTSATLTLSPGGASDDGSSTCDPLGYDFEPTSGSAPDIILEAPLDGAHAVVGIPITLQANVTQLVGHGDVTTGAEPLPERQISWTANGVGVGTGSSLLHTYASPGDYAIKVSAYNKYCLSNSRSATLHVDAPTPALPSVAITQPVDGTVYYVNPPNFLQHVSLVASGTDNVATFTWTDTLTGFLGTGQDLSVNLKLTATGNCAQQTDTITVRGSTSAGAFSIASITVYLKSSDCIR